MTILVTGGGGFLGKCIVEKLVAQGEAVRTFSRAHYDFLDTLGVEQHRGDLADSAAVEKACGDIALVYHVAAKPGIGIRWGEYYRANTLGTENVVAACHKCNVERLVYTSSPSVTFDGSPQSGVDESVPYPTHWLAHYPHSKALAEQLVLENNGKQGLATCSLRPHLIWGPGDHHLIPRLLDRARSGRLMQVGDGTNLVDSIFITNAADAHLQAAAALTSPTSAPAGKAYFLSQDEPVNCWDWINAILAQNDLPPIKKSISLANAKRVGIVCEAIWKTLRLRSEPPMTRFLASQLALDHWFDLSAAKNDFGYAPAVSMEEGMRLLAESSEAQK